MVFIITLSILFLDQSTKLIALNKLSLHQSVPLIEGALHLTLVHNRGAAFGIFKNQLPLFIFVSASAVIMAILTLRSHSRKLGVYTVSLSLILAGAAGNLIDRLRLGYVVDFLDLRVWPVFNVADSAITIGAVLLGWKILFADKSGSPR